MLKRAMWNLSLNIDILNRALNCGSSKQGKADLAYVGSKCVVAKYLQCNYKWKEFKNVFKKVFKILVKLTGVSKSTKHSTSVNYDIFTAILFATRKNISFSFYAHTIHAWNTMYTPIPESKNDSMWVTACCDKGCLTQTDLTLIIW